MSSYERRCNIPNYLMLKPKIEYGEDDLLPLQYVFARPCEPRLWLKEPIPVTLEILNMNPAPVKLYPSTRICQLLFYMMDKAVSRGYDNLWGKYAGKLEPSGSLAFRDSPSQLVIRHGIE